MERKQTQTKSAEPIAIRIYENQKRFHKNWLPHNKTPWTLVLTNESCNALDEFSLPGSGEWCWISNWKIDMAGVPTDNCGWEYASKLRRFQVANRTHKPEPYSADRARRRKWVRFMSRSDCAVSSMARVRSLSSAGPPPVDYDVLIPRIQNSLARVHSARLQVESLMSHSNNGTPTSADRSSFLSSGRASYSSEMQSFLLPLHVHIQEVLTAFDSLELQREPPPTVAGVLKKLRNDVIKEQTALMKLLNPSQTTDSATTMESQANGLRRIDKLTSRAGSMGSNPFAPDMSASSSMNSNFFRSTIGERYDEDLSARSSFGRASDLMSAMAAGEVDTTFRRRGSIGKDEEVKQRDSMQLTGQSENVGPVTLRSIPESSELSSGTPSDYIQQETTTIRRLSLKKENENTTNRSSLHTAMSSSVFSPALPVVISQESHPGVINPSEDTHSRTSLAAYSNTGWIISSTVTTQTVGNSNNINNGTSSGSSNSVSVRSGNANTFNPALLLASTTQISKTEPDKRTDGIFVQRTVEEQRIEQKLQLVDSSDVEARIIDERANEILQIQKSLVQVNEMFADMSRLILDQQEQVDQLYEDSASTNAAAQQALNHLLRANQIQARSSCLVS